MKHIKLGKTGLTVSNLCLGTMNYGTLTDEAEAFRQLDLYVAMGGNFLDTSNNYAHWVPGASGDESETLLGRWLASRGGRDKLVIASKVGYDHHGKDAGLTKEQILRWCDESLRRLGTDYLDLYYAHVDDLSTPQEETMEAFDRLVKQGKVRCLGASNFDTWRMAQADAICREKGYAPFLVNQPCFTYLYAREGWGNPYPLNANAGAERLRYLYDKGMPLVAYSCLASGGYEDDARLPAKYIRGNRLALLRKTAAELGLTPTELVVAWMISLDRVEGMPQVVPLFSSSKAEHLEKILRMGDYVLDDAVLNLLTDATD